MHRWNLQFTGDGTGLYIDEFLKRVEYIAISQNYTFNEVARNLYMFLKGTFNGFQRIQMLHGAE